MDRDLSIKTVNKAMLDNLFWFVAFFSNKVMAMDGMQNILPISDIKTRNTYLGLFVLETICDTFTIIELFMLLKLFYLRLVLADDVTAYIEGERKDFLNITETPLTLRKFKPSKLIKHYGED
jgi:hypothetical protein